MQIQILPELRGQNGAKMKIICTKAEKENLIDSTASSQFCPMGIGFCTNIDADKCAKCFEDNVDWEITNEES